MNFAHRTFCALFLSIFVVCLPTVMVNETLSAELIDKEKITNLLVKGNIDEIRSIGPSAIDVLVQLYRESDKDTRVIIANAFYKLGVNSPEAKKALLQDIYTTDKRLRITVQYALGRVSNDDEVVEVLLDNMRNDPSPLFRDKAACALAYDQIHLTDIQKIKLYEGLIHALDDPNPQVRHISITALEIHTGQRKGYNPNDDLIERTEEVRLWKQWLEKYKSNIY